MNAQADRIPHIEQIAAGDGRMLHLRVWRPDAAPRAVIQIAHGMAEHGGRYARLATALADAGYVVYVHDHRGHGWSVAEPGELGHVADEDGWTTALADLRLVQQRASADWPGLPLVLLGHSMGSFLTQQFLFEHGDSLAAAVICSSNGRPPATTRAGIWVARLERWRLGRTGRSALMTQLVFGPYNRRFRPARTPYDWLSRDPREVDTYMKDARCGFRMSAQFWCDFLPALIEMHRPARHRRIPKTLPILLLTGTHDPLSNGAKGVGQLVDAYRQAGLTRVTAKYYDEARHELFNETNRADVTADLLSWLQTELG